MTNHSSLPLSPVDIGIAREVPMRFANVGGVRKLVATINVLADENTRMRKALEKIVSEDDDRVIPNEHVRALCAIARKALLP
jgi:hypothetical protein